MKRILLLLMLAIPFVGFTDSGKKKCCAKKNVARCVGSANCRACKNCKFCKYCNSGGSCGVCSLRKGKKITTSKSYSAQCNAITKKGTRCSRSSRSNGYCWQHGG